MASVIRYWNCLGSLLWTTESVLWTTESVLWTTESVVGSARRGWIALRDAGDFPALTEHITKMRPAAGFLGCYATLPMFVLVSAADPSPNSSSMSDPTAIIAYDIEQELNRMLIPVWYYMDVACITLTLYEHLLSFEAERRVIWGRKFNLPNILFLLNRYLLVLFSLSLVLWGLVEPWGSDKMCQMSGIFNYLVNILIVLVGGVFSSLRIHAINGQRWLWTSLVLVLTCGSAPFYLAGLLVTTFHSYKGAGLPIARGCYEATPHLEYASWNWGAVAVQACGCVGSAIDLGITWYRTKDIISVVRTRTKPSLASSMLQSGVVYCLVALIFNIIQFYFFVTHAMSLAKFSVTIDSILMSRFILNLRLLDGRDPAFEMSTASGLPTLVSRCPGQIGGMSALSLANLGAPLDFNGEPDEEDQDQDELHLLDVISSRN